MKKAMILAAGRGERMRPLSDTTPKPLLSVGGHCLIEYHLYALQAAGIQEVIVNICYHPKKIMQALGDGKRYGLNILYSFEQGKPLGTGGGIVQALPLLGKEPFILVSGDIWTDYSFGALNLHRDTLGHLVLVNNPVYHPQGDFGLEKSGEVTMSSPHHTYANIALLHPDLFANFESGSYPLAPILREAINKQQISGELYQGQWFNVGTPQQLKALQEQFARLS